MKHLKKYESFLLLEGDTYTKVKELNEENKSIIVGLLIFSTCLLILCSPTILFLNLKLLHHR